MILDAPAQIAVPPQASSRVLVGRSLPILHVDDELGSVGVSTHTVSVF